MSFAFIVLSHSQPMQLLRLTRTLTAIYKDPVIVCHHDFSQSKLNMSMFDSNVQFVQPHVSTRYGKISVVTAGMKAFQLAAEHKSRPKWFSLLSGADYPISSREDAEHNLSLGGADVYIDARKIDYEAYRRAAQETQSTCERGFSRNSYIRLAYDRYRSVRVRVPHWKHPLRPPAAMTLHIRHPSLVDRFSPFSRSFQCYAGEHWFTANRKAVDWLLAGDSTHIDLLRFLAPRPFVDECAYQTLFCNRHTLKVSPDNLRFISWDAGDAERPNWLAIENLADILRSKKNFARKIAADSPLLNAIDKLLGVHF